MRCVEGGIYCSNAVDESIRRLNSWGMESRPNVLIVGAGLGGLAAARDLARDGLKVHLLDKSRGVSGRAATRWLEVDGKTIRIDHGAQYFTVRSDPMRILLPELIQRGIVQEWTKGFPVLSERGIKPRSSGHPRYMCPEGMSALGKALQNGIGSEDKPLALETLANVTGLYQNQQDGSWVAMLEDGSIRHSEALLLNLPAPQALKLANPYLKSEVRMALEAVRFEPCWAVILLPEQMPYLDWVGLEIEHPILRWAALDHTKRPVQDPPVLVLHTSPAWSQAHLELSPDQALEQIIAAAKDLFGDWVGNYRYAQAHRWRFALASQSHPWPYLAQDNLVFCGDWCTPAHNVPRHTSRIEVALQSGWAAADYLAGYFSQEKINSDITGGV